MAVQTTYSEAMAIGFAGMVADGHPLRSVDMMRNNEASASIAFGSAVQFEGSTDDQGALIPSTVNDVIAGLVVHAHTYDVDRQLDSDGKVVAGEELNVARAGRLLVVCEDGCSPGDRLHIRAVADGTKLPGALLADAVVAETIDSSNQGVWRSTATAGGLAWLEFDFVNAMTTAAP